MFEKNQRVGFKDSQCKVLISVIDALDILSCGRNLAMPTPKTGSVVRPRVKQRCFSWMNWESGITHPVLASRAS